MKCNTCGRAAGAPFRVYDPRGKVISGCVDDFHSGHLVNISESNRWHNRPEAKKIRAALKRGQSGKGYKSNPRPRVGTAKSGRVSSATGKRPTKRLVSRRKKNARKGYFPNPSKISSIANYYIADTMNGQGFEYGWDGVTSIGWSVGRGRRLPNRTKHGRVTYGYMIPLNVTRTTKFKNWFAENAGKEFYATRKGLAQKFAAML